MKVALVHDWLTGLRGGEKCLQAFLQLYPDADIFTLLHLPGTTDPLIDSRVRETSFLQRIPGIKKHYRLCLPLYPAAIKKFDFSGYDLVISLSHAAAKNIRVPEGTIHFCYCFSPMRYIWDQTFSYFGSVTPLLWPLVRYLREWDLNGCRDVDHFVAISKFVAARIRCFYGRSASLLYPPVSTAWIEPRQSYKPGVAFLYAGALVPYKRVDLVVKAFNKLGEELWIVGSGPEERKLRRQAKTNISFLGKVSNQELASFFRNCRALLFPGIEDFGMIPVECMASGRPVIGAFGGGLLESLKGIRPWLPEEQLEPAGASGVFIEPDKKQAVKAIIAAVDFFIKHEHRFQPRTCVNQAQRFGVERFRKGWSSLLLEKGLSSLLPAKRENIDAQTEAAMV